MIDSLVARFKKYAPDFPGEATTEESVRDVMSVIKKANLAEGYGGSFLSHFGNKQWM